METFLLTLAAIALLVSIVALIRWKVRRDWARIERKMAERDHATLQSYKKHTIPDRRSSPDTIPSSTSRSSPTADTCASPAWDIPAMSAITRSAEPSGLEQTVVGADYMDDGLRAQIKAMNTKAKWPNQDEVEALRAKVTMLETAASKSSQGGYLNLDFTPFFAILVIVGVVIGIALTVGVPWVWEQAKPFIHAVTA